MKRRQFIKKGALFVPVTFGIFVPSRAASIVMQTPAIGTKVAAGGGSITYDNALMGQSWAALTSSGSFSYTNNGNLLLCIFHYGHGSTQTLTSITYAGASLSSISGFSAHDGAWNGVVGYYKTSPATGSNTLAWTASTSTQLGIIGIISFSNANTGAPFGTAATGTSTADAEPTVTVSSATGEIIVAAAMTDGNTSISIDSPGTSRYEADGLNADSSGGGGTWAGAASQACDWTAVGGNGWAEAGISCK